MFKGKLFQAAIIVSIILVSSAIFISQTDRIFGKAAMTTISGTMVLHDSTVPVSSVNVVLPGASCSTSLLACGDTNPTKVTSYSGNSYDPLPFSSPQGGTTGHCTWGTVPSGSVACGWDGTVCCSTCGDSWGNAISAHYCNISAGYECAGTNTRGGGYGCCPVGTFYNPGDHKCYDNKVSYNLKQNRLCGYTYSPLPIAPSNLDFDVDVKYVSISYSCSP